MKAWHAFLIGLGSALGLALLLGAILFARPYNFQGTLYDPPFEVSDFQLTDQDGKPIHFDTLRGSSADSKVVLIFFGYTHCPDVCPVTLVEFKKIKEQLQDQAEYVRFVFITVDPERDTADVLDKHLANFDPTFVGLTGSREELEPVWQTFGVYQARDDSGSAAGYLVSHTSRTYAIDLHGDLRLTYAFGTEPEAIVKDVQHLLIEK